jgi:hypothetical protein
VLRVFRGLICSRASISRPFLRSAQSSSIATLHDTLNLWPTTFLQACVHMALWGLASQDIYNKTCGYIFCKFFPCKGFDNKHAIQEWTSFQYKCWPPMVTS